MNAETQYLSIMKDILDRGDEYADRTGTGTLALFGASLRHDFSEGFPLLTTKKVFTKGVLVELLWFLKGTEDPSFLIENDVHIWDEWMKSDDHGNKYLPETYGFQWRNFNNQGVDQLQGVIDAIKNNPNSRRHIVSAWNPLVVEKTALPWCHILQQYNVRGKYLDLMVVQRSADWLLGVPFNIASYSFLLAMVCQLTGYQPGQLYYTFANAHIYKNHIEQCKLQLTREPRALPTLQLANKSNINDFALEDFNIIGYDPHPAIKAAVSI